MVKQTMINISGLQNALPHSANFLIGNNYKLTLWNYLLLSFIFTLLLSDLSMAAVTASTNRQVLSIDETIQLSIKSDQSSTAPDLSVLDKDFQIMGRSQSQNYSLINGHASQTHSWNISLLPKKTGELIIPSIQVGSDTTKAISLVIKAQSLTPGVDGKDIYLKLNLEDNSQQKEFYVQQQIFLTVQLFHRVRFTNATLDELEIENTVVEKMGNDSNYTKTIGNNRYNIIERRYAIYPQQSGPLVIPALRFAGNAEVSQSFSLFSRPGRQIISRTKPLSLNILPIPENYSGKNWLPAESLEIESEILDNSQEIVVGEAFTRHIIIRAKGLLSSQLPKSSIISSQFFKTYPDKEKLNNQLVNGKVMGIRRDTIAIIPLKAGQFTLPEINISWWNTMTKQQETAHLAARTLVAKANTEQAVETKKALASKVVQAEQDNKSVGQTVDKQPVEPDIIKNTAITTTNMLHNPWFWVSMALLLLWLLTLGFVFFIKDNRQHSDKTKSEQLKSTTNSPTQAQQQLQSVYQACDDNNAHQASQSLVQWASHYFKQPMLSGLLALEEFISQTALNKAISELESSLYAENKTPWQGKQLKAQLAAYLQQKDNQKKAQRKKTPQALSSLNP